MAARFLITTALEETWPERGPVLFAGEWCRRFSRRERWRALDGEVLTYHWDDRLKLHRDYRYLQEFCERLLEELSGKLNEIHGVAHGVRYWRILVGLWLTYFVQMLFDRWTSIHQAVTHDDLSGTIVLTGDEDAFVPRDMVDFHRLYVGDEWNHYLYGIIIREFTGMPYTTRARRETGLSQRPDSRGTWMRSVRQGFIRNYNRAANLFGGNDGAFFLATFLPIRDELRLHRRFARLPRFWTAVPTVIVSVDRRQRNWSLRGTSGSAFEACARAMLPRQIPTAYLEGYGRLVEQTRRVPWPRRPKVIWTSNAFDADDVFKAWAGEKAERGHPLVIGQHGGHYGIGRWSTVEDHEISISDRYLTWGWSEMRQPKVRSVGQFKGARPLGIRHAEQKRALLVTASVPRQSYFMYSVVVARQWLDYFDDQCAFVASLPPDICKALTIRTYFHDYGWDHVARWRERYPEVQLDDCRAPIASLIRASRLYIATYNATTFLESFAMDVPTIIYWNPGHWELRDSAVPFFDELKRAGVFHESPESAAFQVASIWSDVDAWWKSPGVRSAVERFKEGYCRVPDNLVDRIEGVLRETIASSAAQSGAFRGRGARASAR